MNPDKPFRTYDEQIEILRKRNVVITDEQFAKDCLSSISYYSLINGYKNLFPVNDEDKFINPINFNDFYLLNFLDRNMNNIIFKYIIMIEKKLKTAMAYRISEKYGVETNLKIKINKDPTDYLSVTHYRNDNKTHNTITSVKAAAEFSKNESIKHYKEKHNHLPCWILMNGIYFGLAIRLYLILTPDDKEYICNHMINNNKLSIAEKKSFVFKSLTILREYRNNIAHGNRTFSNLIDERLPKKLVLRLSNGGLTKTDYAKGIGKNDIFAVILAICNFIDEDNKKIFIDELKSVFRVFNNIVFSTNQNVFEILSLPHDFIDRLNKL